MTLCNVRVRNIRCRQEVDSKVVDSMAYELRWRKRWPKAFGRVELMRHQGSYWIVDGNHRVAAAKMAGRPRVPAVVVECDMDGNVRPEEAGALYFWRIGGRDGS